MSSCVLYVGVEEVEDRTHGSGARVAQEETVAGPGDDGGVEDGDLGEHGLRVLDQVGGLALDGDGGHAVTSAEGHVAVWRRSRLENERRKETKGGETERVSVGLPPVIIMAGPLNWLGTPPPEPTVRISPGVFGCPFLYM